MQKQLAALTLALVAVFAIATQHNSKADADLAVKYIKDLTKAATMYSEDCDDLLPPDKKRVGEIYPYTQHGDQFRPFTADTPSTAYFYRQSSGPIMILPASFVFNPALYKANLEKVKANPRVVMWSYGPQGHLGFAFKGKTLVSFVDGTTKFVPRAEAKKLRWKP